MATLRIIDSITDRGDPRRDNEDSFGGNRHCAFVIDGATGLGGDFLDAGTSDAAWLARFAKDSFETLVVGDRSVHAAVRLNNERVRAVVEQASEGEPLPAWRLPVAGFQMVHLLNGRLTTCGLGDCRIFCIDADGRFLDASPMPEGQAQESREAQAALAHVGGAAQAALSDHPYIRDTLRERRARYNRPEGEVWTLGAEPAAADHVASLDIPLRPPVRGMLCTDGFAALVDAYGRYDGRTLIACGFEGGLVPLLGALRRIERREDPDRRLYPRFKVSDDATAVLFEVR